MPDPISWAYDWPYFAAALIASYLIGSIPFGLILTRLAGLGDIREIGSGNIGATNVLRTGNKRLAAATLLLDGGKGSVAVVLGHLYGPDIAVTTAAGAVLGHMFPVWVVFKGGKGVATTLGVRLGLTWPAGLVACGVWAVVAAASRYSSLASLTAIVSAVGFTYLLAGPQFAEVVGLLAILVIIKHLGNIRRLIKGKESKIGKIRK